MSHLPFSQTFRCSSLERIADSRHLRLWRSHINVLIIAHLCHTAIRSIKGAACEVDKAGSVTARSDLDGGDAERVVCWGIGC